MVTVKVVRHELQTMRSVVHHSMHLKWTTMHRRRRYSALRVWQRNVLAVGMEMLDHNFLEHFLKFILDVI